MVENLCLFYDRELAFNKLVIMKNKWYQNVLVVLFFFIGECFLGYSFFLSYFIYKMLFALIGVAISLFSFYIGTKFNDITIKKNFYDRKGLDEYVVFKLIEYLEQKNINEKNGIEKIKELVKIKAEKEKLPLLLSVSTIAVLFVPLWNNYLNRVLEIYKLDTRNMTFVTAILTIFIFLIAFLRPTLIFFHDNFITRYYKLNKIVDLLDEIIITKFSN